MDVLYENIWADLWFVEDQILAHQLKRGFPEMNNWTFIT